MTAIAGLVHGSRVYIGGDSAGVSGYSVTVRRDKKVFQNGPMVFGFSGSFRVGQVLEHALVIPERPADTSVDKFMCTLFVDAVRNALTDAGAMRKTSEEDNPRTLFLVGYEGRLFRVHYDLQVGESDDGYDAVGCAEDYVLGYLYATESVDYTPEQRIFGALACAERYSGGVCGPFTLRVS